MEDKSKHILKIIFGCRTGSVPSELEAMHLSDDDERKVISKSQDLFAAIVQTK